MHIVSKIKKSFYNKKIKKEGGQFFSSSLRILYAKKYDIHIGYGTYGGCFDIENIPAGTYFGNYCSIAKDVKIFRANHPLDYFTLHPLFYNPIIGYVKKDMLQRPILKIGHDVWIGSSSIILSSVRCIGNGAIIGAGSIVTKDVPPYAIVAGNPARLIKMRFSDEIIEKLEETQWWNLNKDDLIKNKENMEKIVSEK